MKNINIERLWIQNFKGVVRDNPVHIREPFFYHQFIPEMWLVLQRKPSRQ